MGNTGARVAGSLARGAFGIGDALMQIGARQRQDEQAETERKRADRDRQFQAQTMGYAIMNPDSPDWSYGGYDASKDTSVQRAKAVEDARIAAAQNLVQRRVQNLYGEKNDQGSFENPAELEAHADTDADYIAMDFVNRFGQDKAGAMAAIQSVPHEIGRKAQARLKGFYAERDLAEATEKPEDVRTGFQPGTGALVNMDTGAIIAQGQPQQAPGAEGAPPSLNAEQSKSVQFYQRGAPALEKLEGLVRAGGVPGGGARTLGAVPFVGNRLKGQGAQLYDATVHELVTALLRKDSGATITKGEMDIAYDTYIPRAGEGPEVVAQKLAAARRAIESLRSTAGPGASMMQSPPGGQRQYSPNNPFRPTGG